MQSFFDGCVAAGPEACAFYAPTSEEISNNLDSLYESLRAQPVPVVTPSFYGVVDYAVLRTAVRSSLYQPYALFSTLAEGLAGLAAGNGSIIYGMQAQTNDDTSSVYENSLDAGIAIFCSDALKNTDSVADLFAYWDSIKGLSVFADILFSQRISCSCVLLFLDMCVCTNSFFFSGWKFHRDGKFTGEVSPAQMTVACSEVSLGRSDYRKYQLPYSSAREHGWYVHRPRVFLSY